MCADPITVDLTGTVAVVTGASRGLGRACATVLGGCGATVYVTGRSRRGNEGTDGMPGTVDGTADEVTARGGRGIAVACDHTDDAAVAALAARIESEQGRLDLLVSNAWGGYEERAGTRWDRPFWEQPPTLWDAMFTSGVRMHLTTAVHLAPLLLRHRDVRPGLLVATIAWSYGDYIGNVFYDTAKGAVARAVFAMSHDLRPHGVAAVALAPGFMRTERVRAAGADLTATESPDYAARAVAQLAADPRVLRWTGQVVTAGDLAREYGFTDVDGRRPAPFRMPGT